MPLAIKKSKDIGIAECCDICLQPFKTGDDACAVICGRAICDNAEEVEQAKLLMPEHEMEKTYYIENSNQTLQNGEDNFLVGHYTCLIKH